MLRMVVVLLAASREVVKKVVPLPLSVAEEEMRRSVRDQLALLVILPAMVMEEVLTVPKRASS